MSRLKKCPFCNSKLAYKDYGTYYDPLEWFLECKVCWKFRKSYFYYDGYYLRLDKWEKCNVESDSPEMEEFERRLKLLTDD